MSIIQFENGVKVNFNGTPTQKDVEEVANKLGINKPKATQAAPPAQETGGLGGFLKGLASAPATLLARPFQAVAGLAGANLEDIDKFSSKYSGGLVAPTPKNFGDVNKDIGRGIQTVSLGLGPVSAGAGIGLGTSIEQGASTSQTALNTAGGAVAGKLLGLVGKPLLDVSGRVIGKITPQIIKDISGRGAQAVEKFAAQHQVMPKAVGDLVNTGAKKLETLANKPFNAVGSLVKKPALTLEETAIKDATPAYNKKLIGKGSSMVDGVPRIQEGGGLTKIRKVTATKSEIEAGKELAKVKGYPTKGTALEKYNYIEPEIARRGEAMQVSLANEKILRPPKEVSKLIRDAVNKASKDSLLLQKADPIVKNYLRVAERAIKQSDGTLAGELRVRQILDNAYDDAGGKYMQNKGLDQIHRAARNALNDDLEAKAINTAVKAELKAMSNLYKAMDTLQDKAMNEGGSALEQAMKNHPVATKATKTVGNLTGLGGIVNLAN